MSKFEQRPSGRKVCSSVVLVPKFSQPNELLRLDVAILDALSPAYTECCRNLIPCFAIMEGPPLPTTVLSAETLDNLLATRMTVNILRGVEDDVIYYDPYGQVSMG